MEATLTYSLDLERSVNGKRIDAGDSVMFSPTVSFIPNRDSSLSFGFTWSRTQRDMIDGVVDSIPDTHTSLHLGFGYSWSKQTSVFSSVNANLSGTSGATLAMTISHDLERKAQK